MKDSETLLQRMSELHNQIQDAWLRYQEAIKKTKDERISTLILKSRQKCLTDKTECLLLNELFEFNKSNNKNK